MEQRYILEICSQVPFVCPDSKIFLKEMIIFLKLAISQLWTSSTFFPRPVCLRILITLQDDSLESVVDAHLFQFWHICREGGDWLDFVKIVIHAENFQSHFFPRYQCVVAYSPYLGPRGCGRRFLSKNGWLKNILEFFQGHFCEFCGFFKMILEFFLP